LGNLLVLHIAKALEDAGKTGNLVAIDGSPLMMKTFREEIGLADTARSLFKDAVLMTVMQIEYKEKMVDLAETALSGETWEQKLESFIKFSTTDSRSQKKYSKNLIQGLVNRLMMTESLDLDSFPVLCSTEILVVVPTEKLVTGLSADLGLRRYTTKLVQSSTLSGNHLSVVKSPEFLKLLLK
jgi:thioesterase domain-containing protein